MSGWSASASRSTSAAPLGGVALAVGPQAIARRWCGGRPSARRSVVGVVVEDQGAARRRGAGARRRRRPGGSSVRTSSGGPLATTRPASSSRWSAAAASPRSWVDTTTARPAARSAAMASRMCWRDTRSRPVIGSSSRSRSASWARPWATKARWRCPPESSRSGRRGEVGDARAPPWPRRRPRGRRRAGGGAGRPWRSGPWSRSRGRVSGRCALTWVACRT